MAALDFPTSPTDGQTYSANGYIWTYNSATTSWLSSNLGAPTGGGSDAIFYLNDQTVTSNYTIPTGDNAGSFGPITIASGVTITIPSGQTWTVV
jgi:hypothetical protein